MRLPRPILSGLALAATLGASAWAVAPARSAATAQPHALKLLMNGKQLPITPFGGPDYYNPIRAAKLRVQARWKGDLRGTGFKVVISTTEPTVRTYRTCSTGTSCLVPKLVPVLNGEQMSWIVRIMKVKPHFVKIVGGFMVCLARRAHPS